MTHLFLYTNIVLDVLVNREPFAKPAAKLFDLAAEGKIKLCISALSYSHIAYIIKKYCTHKELLFLLRELERLTITMDLTKEIILKTVAGNAKELEDAIQYFTALSDKKITAIITRNTRDFKDSILPVYTAEEAVGMLHLSDT